MKAWVWRPGPGSIAAPDRAAPPRRNTLHRLLIRRLVLPAALTLLALGLHVALPEQGVAGNLRLFAGTGVWLVLST